MALPPLQLRLTTIPPAAPNDINQLVDEVSSSVGIIIGLVVACLFCCFVFVFVAGLFVWYAKRLQEWENAMEQGSGANPLYENGAAGAGMGGNGRVRYTVTGKRVAPPPNIPGLTPMFNRMTRTAAFDRVSRAFGQQKPPPAPMRQMTSQELLGSSMTPGGSFVSAPPQAPARPTPTPPARPGVPPRGAPPRPPPR